VSTDGFGERGGGGGGDFLCGPSHGAAAHVAANLEVSVVQTLHTQASTHKHQ
jgi:hypothetical protein